MEAEGAALNRGWVSAWGSSKPETGPGAMEAHDAEPSSSQQPGSCRSKSSQSNTKWMGLSSIVKHIRRSLDVHLKNYFKIDSALSASFRHEGTTHKRMDALIAGMVDTGLVDFASVSLVNASKRTFGVASLAGAGCQYFPHRLLPTRNCAKQLRRLPSKLTVFNRSVFALDGSNWAVEDVTNSCAPWYYDCTDMVYGQPKEAAWLKRVGMKSVLALPCSTEGVVRGVLVVAMRAKAVDHSLLRTLEELCTRVTPFVVDALSELAPGALSDTRMISRFESISDFAQDCLWEMQTLDRKLDSPAMTEPCTRSSAPATTGSTRRGIAAHQPQARAECGVPAGLPRAPVPAQVHVPSMAAGLLQSDLMEQLNDLPNLSAALRSIQPARAVSAKATAPKATYSTPFPSFTLSNAEGRQCCGMLFAQQQQAQAQPSTPAAPACAVGMAHAAVAAAQAGQALYVDAACSQSMSYEDALTCGSAIGYSIGAYGGKTNHEAAAAAGALSGPEQAVLNPHKLPCLPAAATGACPVQSVQQAHTAWDNFCPSSTPSGFYSSLPQIEIGSPMLEASAGTYCDSAGCLSASEPLPMLKTAPAENEYMQQDTYQFIQQFLPGAGEEDEKDFSAENSHAVGSSEGTPGRYAQLPVAYTCRVQQTLPPHLASEHGYFCAPSASGLDQASTRCFGGSCSSNAYNSSINMLHHAHVAIQPSLGSSRGTERRAVPAAFAPPFVGSDGSSSNRNIATPALLAQLRVIVSMQAQAMQQGQAAVPQARICSPHVQLYSSTGAVQPVAVEALSGFFSQAAPILPSSMATSEAGYVTSASRTCCTYPYGSTNGMTNTASCAGQSIGMWTYGHATHGDAAAKGVETSAAASAAANAMAAVAGPALWQSLGRAHAMQTHGSVHEYTDTLALPLAVASDSLIASKISGSGPQVMLAHEQAHSLPRLARRERRRSDTDYANGNSAWPVARVFSSHVGRLSASPLPSTTACTSWAGSIHSSTNALGSFKTSVRPRAPMALTAGMGSPQPPQAPHAGRLSRLVLSEEILQAADVAGTTGGLCGTQGCAGARSVALLACPNFAATLAVLVE